MSRTLFITGCATGFGRALAEAALSAGHKVIATDPSLAALTSLKGSDAQLLRFALDVRDSTAVTAAVAAANAFSPVDTYINNGGYAFFSTIETADLDQFSEMFDVNVTGGMRVLQALLPQLRACSGTVVALSSVAGRVVFPESGYYAATKYAVEALHEALIQETATFGIKVRLIQPGSFNTKFLATATEKSPKKDPTGDYAHLYELWDSRKFSILASPQDPMLVVNAILSSLEHPAPFMRIPVGKDAHQLLAVREAVSNDAWVRLMADRNGLDAPHQPTDLPGPKAFISNIKNLSAAQKKGLITAKAAGHLDHWSDSPHGEAALALVNTLVP
jgi:NADP-dependent 3-hydroxy acid dehydrogenase YdfG